MSLAEVPAVDLVFANLVAHDPLGGLKQSRGFGLVTLGRSEGIQQKSESSTSIRNRRFELNTLQASQPISMSL
jgi:hypothetical protein